MKTKKFTPKAQATQTTQKSRRFTQKIKKSLLVTVIAFFTLVTVTLTVYGEAFAKASSTDIKNARQNTAIKVLAKNLAECYENAKQSIDFKNNRIWDFTSKNATTYWENPSMQVYYPDVLAGKTGKEKSSNCGEMITGWHTNWFIKLFTDEGDFVGVDQKVVVPDVSTNEEAFYNNELAMQQYLSGVGYDASNSSSEALNGDQCIYFHLSTYPAAFENSHYNYPTPANYTTDTNGHIQFISRQTYCVHMQDDGKHIDFKYATPKILIGSDDDGNILYRKEAGRPQLDLQGEFRVDPIKSINNGKKVFFATTIWMVQGYYAITDINGDIRQIEDSDGRLDITNTLDASGCAVTDSVKSLIGLTTTPFCSLTSPVDTNSTPTLTFDQFKDRFTEYLGSLKATTGGDDNFALFSTVTPLTLNADDATATFEKTGGEATFVNYFFDQNGRTIVENGYALDIVEQYMFYYDHLKDYFAENSSEVDYLHDSETDSPNAVPVLWLNESTGEFEHKYIEIEAPAHPTACALAGDVWPGADCGGHQEDWRYFAEQLGGFDEEELKDAFHDIENLDEDYGDATDRLNSKGDTDPNSCQSKGAVLSMGWIFCQILQITGRAVNGIYNNVLVPQLKIEPQLFTGKNGDNPTEQAWNIFRNMANTAFVVALLVIIFSQLTGVGIDNYGIKRTLPKLIVAAILVNLSYIICQLAVDLSNILGNGLQSLLQSLPAGGGDQVLSDMVDRVDAVKGTYQIDTGSTITAVTLVAVAVGGAFSAIFVETAGLVSLLASAVGALVSLIFLFILLAARQAAIVILVVVSPVAFVCYMLPNTKKLFDKWLKLGSSLLLVYPICGLLIGGGNYISKLLLAVNNDTWMSAIVAIVAGIIPLFFIPSILRNAFSAMGNLGAKITGFGQRMGNGAMRLTRNTRTFKNLENRAKSWSEYNNTEAAARRAQRTMNRFGGRNRKSLSKRQQDRLLEAEQFMQQYRANRAKASVGEAVMSETYAEAEAQDQRNVKQGQYNAGKVVTDVEVAQIQAENENTTRAATNQYQPARITQKYANAQAQSDQITKQAQYDKGLPVVTEAYAKAQAENEFNVRQAEIDNPAPIVDLPLASQRIQSANEAKEFKNYTDQFATKTQSQMATALTDAVTAYSAPGGRTKENALRLQAAIAAAESRGMYSEMFSASTGLTNLQLQAQDSQGNETTDAKILGQLAQSQNKVLSTYGKTRSKPANQTTGKSVNDFTKAGHNAATGDSLQDALASKGAAVLNNVDDDTLNYIRSTNASAISTETLVNAVGATTNDKELKLLNSMLSVREGGTGTDSLGRARYEMSVQQLTRLNPEAIKQIKSNNNAALYTRALNELKATRNTDATRQLISGMSQEARQELGL